MSQNKDEEARNKPIAPGHSISDSRIYMDDSGPSRIESEPIMNMKRSLDDDSPTVERAQSASRLERPDLKISSVPPHPIQAQEYSGDKPTVSQSVKRVVQWTMTGFFDWNPGYFIQVRGLMNIIHVILNLTCIILLSQICKLSERIGGNSDEFICKPPETFLFVTVCGAFLTSILYLVCCMLSRQTSHFLFMTSFEISYFALYFILLLTASITLMISTESWNTYERESDRNYYAVQTVAIVGLASSIIYGISGVWFFISHKYYDVSSELQV